jgi:hypothetical protein
MLVFTGHLYFSNKLFESYFLYNSEDRNGGEAGISVVISVVCSSEFWCKYFRFECNCINYYLQKWTPFLLKIFIKNMNFKRDIIKTRYLGLL